GGPPEELHLDEAVARHEVSLHADRVGQVVGIDVGRAAVVAHDLDGVAQAGDRLGLRDGQVLDLRRRRGVGRASVDGQGGIGGRGGAFAAAARGEAKTGEDEASRRLHNGRCTPFSFRMPHPDRGAHARAGPRRAAARGGGGADRNVPVDVRTMDELLRESLARRRLSTLLLGLFAATALALALIGIYGVVAYGVAQRGHEMSLRLALGARPRQVVALVVGHGLRLGLAGVCLGVALGLLLARALEGLLFGVEPTDPATFAATGLLVVGVTVAAAWRPARRAGRLDPMAALRAG